MHARHVGVKPAGTQCTLASSAQARHYHLRWPCMSALAPRTAAWRKRELGSEATRSAHAAGPSVRSARRIGLAYAPELGRTVL